MERLTLIVIKSPLVHQSLPMLDKSKREYQVVYISPTVTRQILPQGDLRKLLRSSGSRGLKLSTELAEDPDQLTS